MIKDIRFSEEFDRAFKRLKKLFPSEKILNREPHSLLMTR